MKLSKAFIIGVGVSWSIEAQVSDEYGFCVHK